MKSKNDNLKKNHQRLERKVENLEEALIMLTFNSDDNSIVNHKRATSMVELTDVNEDELKDDESNYIMKVNRFLII
jgi:hypothetical protein